jgi:hypothetical protein
MGSLSYLATSWIQSPFRDDRAHSRFSVLGRAAEHDDPRGRLFQLESRPK